MKKIMIIFLIFISGGILTSCQNNEEISDETQIETEIIKPTIDKLDEPQLEINKEDIIEELKDYSNYIFLNITSESNVNLQEKIHEYEISWDYDTNFFDGSNNNLYLKKNGQTTIEATISKDDVSVSSSFEIYIVNDKIEQIYQHDLMFYYMFIINNPQKLGEYFAPTELVFHNTANTASAANEVAYLDSLSNTSATSYHFAVDDTGIYQAIPTNVYAYHAGDETHNQMSLGIEIAKSLSTDEYIKDMCIENAIELIKLLQHYYNIEIEDILTHQDCSGKYCPHDILDRYGLDNFYHELICEE